MSDINQHIEKKLLRKISIQIFNTVLKMVKLSKNTVLLPTKLFVSFNF